MEDKRRNFFSGITIIILPNIILDFIFLGSYCFFFHLEHEQCTNSSHQDINTKFLVQDEEKKVCPCKSFNKLIG